MARIANSLARLRDQINAKAPNRNKASDGWIGDAAHAASASDHNPNSAGVVTALDITNDPASGIDIHAIADRLRINRHPDLKYIISNSRIAGAWTGWNWTPYYGSNPHNKHAHFSVGRGNDGQSQPPYDDTNDWAIGGGSAPQPGKSLDAVAREVIAGNWGNGQDRVNALVSAGYNYNDVQNAVNAILGGGAPAPAKKSNEEVAQEVLKGYWGNGTDRQAKLAAAGYDYNVIQGIVNTKVSTSPVPARKSNEQIAGEVLRGEWGNGDERRNRLQAAGYDYNAVQGVVNASVAPARKSNDQVADEVIRGEWGNGADRANRLRAAGFDPNAVQAIVNRKV
jgi:hypothetical protein